MKLRYPFHVVYAAVMLAFLSGCSNSGTGAQTAPVVRLHPPAVRELPDGTPAVMTFEGLTRVEALSARDLENAKRNAIANAAFTESRFAEVPARSLCMGFRDGWVYLIHTDPEKNDGFVYMTRTRDGITEEVGPVLESEEYFTPFFSFTENGEVLFLHSPKIMSPMGRIIFPETQVGSAEASYSKYSVDSGGFTETVPRTNFRGAYEGVSPFYYGGYVYFFSENDKGIYKVSADGFADFEKVLPHEVYSFNTDAAGRLYIYYKSDSPKFGVYDLNDPSMTPLLEVPYNMTNIYGTSVVGFNPVDGGYYRATNNQFQKLDEVSGMWDPVLTLGEETELETVKGMGTRYEYTGFFINEDGEFFLAVNVFDTETKRETTEINKYVRK